MSLLLVASAAAHPARVASATARIENDGSYRLVVNFDLPAYLLNEPAATVSDEPMNALLDGPATSLEQELTDARDRLLANVTVVADGVDAPPTSIELPSLLQVQELARETPRLPLMADAVFRGQVDRAAKSVCFRLPEVIGDVVLTVEQPGLEASVEPVRAGQFSSLIALRLDSAQPTSTARPSEPSRSFLATSIQFVHWGFTHILPHGLDHILFVLGLFLLSDKLKPLLWQVTAFTLAHSITLVLSILGWVNLPEWIVEPIIAASIAFIAIENLFTRDLKPWRPFVVFAFGLVHGLGFAGVLREAGLPAGQLVNAVVSFNVGVELGQLAVIGLAALLVGWFRNRDWYRTAITIPASVCIALIALFWTVERTGLI